MACIPHPAHPLGQPQGASRTPPAGSSSPAAAPPVPKPEGNSWDRGQPCPGAPEEDSGEERRWMPRGDRARQPLSYVSEPHAAPCFRIDLVWELVYAKQTLLDY